MHESLGCDHMPKIATARNKAMQLTGTKEVCWAKEKSRENGSVGRLEKEFFLVWP